MSCCCCCCCCCVQCLGLSRYGVGQQPLPADLRPMGSIGIADSSPPPGPRRSRTRLGEDWHFAPGICQACCCNYNQMCPRLCCPTIQFWFLLSWLLSVAAVQQLAGRRSRRLGRHVHRAHDGRDPRSVGRSRAVQSDAGRGGQGVPVDCRPGPTGGSHRPRAQRSRRNRQPVH